MTSSALTRRFFLSGALAATGAALLPLAPGYAAPEKAKDWTGSKSANGWPIVPHAKVFRIEGSNESVAIAEGDPAALLLHVARRFNYEIDTIRTGELVGHITDRSVSQPYESNYLSGTAIALRPSLYPAGAHGLLYPQELAVVRDIIAELGGAVSWGGDEEVPKESHFQLALPPNHPLLKSTAQRVRKGEAMSRSKGVGAINAFKV